MSAPSQPLLTLITVCRNASGTIERSFHSVARQIPSHGQWEYIVLDGLSSDDTVSIIRKWSDSGLITRWTSEKDEGIYDAMNKAIGLARGHYVAFLNADDELAENALSHCLEAAEKYPSYFYGNARVEEKNGGLHRWIGDSKRLASTAICCHQALWVRRDILVDLGGFDRSAGLSADYDLMWRLLLAHGAGLAINRDLAIYYLGGASDSLESVIASYNVKVRYLNETVNLMNADSSVASFVRRQWLGGILACCLGYPQMEAVRSQLQQTGKSIVKADGPPGEKFLMRLILSLFSLSLPPLDLIAGLLAKVAEILAKRDSIKRQYWKAETEIGESAR